MESGQEHERCRWREYIPYDKVHTVHDQAKGDEDNEDQLVVAQVIFQSVRDPVGEDVSVRVGEFVVPGDGGEVSAGEVGSEEVIEAKRELSRPGADKQDLEERVCEFM
jgi:hypothetical protein